MTLPLSRDMLRACYDFLAETSPFSKWNLPAGEDVAFYIARDRENLGWHTFDGKRHTIHVSRNLVGHTSTLVKLMAHEMIHVHEHHSGACRRGVEHSSAFKKWAKQVCEIHGFDSCNF